MDDAGVGAEGVDALVDVVLDLVVRSVDAGPVAAGEAGPFQEVGVGGPVHPHPDPGAELHQVTGVEEGSGATAPGVSVFTEAGDETLGQPVESRGLDVGVEVFAGELFADRVGQTALVEASVGVGEFDGTLLDQVLQTGVCGGGYQGRSRSCQIWSISVSAVMAWAMVSRVMGVPEANAGS